MIEGAAMEFLDAPLLFPTPLHTKESHPWARNGKAKGKALVADAKGKLFGKLVKEITVAARLAAATPAPIRVCACIFLQVVQQFWHSSPSTASNNHLKIPVQ